MKVVFVSPLQQQQSSFVAAAGGVTIPHASSFAPASSTMSGGGMHTVELGGGSEQGQGLPKPMPIATHVVPTGAASTPATVTTSATTTQQEPAHATTAASGGASAPPAALRCMCFDLTRLSPLFQLVVLSSGVFFFFILNSFLEEYTFKMIDGFKFGWFLTAVQLFCMSGFAMFERIAAGEEIWSHKAALGRHGTVAVAMTASRGLTNVSLEYLNYPTQVVFKSLKLLTVMIGSIWVGRRYSVEEMCAALLTAVSAVCFGLGDIQDAPQFNLLGFVIVIASLVFDSMHSNTQDTLLHEHRATLPETMVFSNVFAGFLSLGVCALIGELGPALTFCFAHPHSWLIFVVQSSVTYLGVLCFVSSIKAFGVVLATTVTTVRKILTVLLSFLVFPNKKLTSMYVYGILLFVASVVLHVHVQRSQAKAGKGIGQTLPAAPKTGTHHTADKQPPQQGDAAGTAADGEDVEMGAVAPLSKGSHRAGASVGSPTNASSRSSRPSSRFAGTTTFANGGDETDTDDESSGGAIYIPSNSLLSHNQSSSNNNNNEEHRM